MNGELRKRLTFSESSRRDFEAIREAWAEFAADLRRPWTYLPGLIAAAVVAAMMLLPWLVDVSDF